ncbi:MAG: YdeI/OmpD-associated family protein, partial [Actinomycetota bacterium]|nr:YdeI/OmpD-associated family protein [Actinomycetota bacterium]
MRFHATVLLGGKTATGIRVPPEVVEGLGSHKRPPVRVTIGNHTYRTTVAVMGGEFMIPLSAENRKSAGVAAGDEVDVGIELDTEPREVSVPPDFSEALGRDSNARRYFDGLSYSHKRRYVMSIDEAKTAETRQRR